MLRPREFKPEWNISVTHGFVVKRKDGMTLGIAMTSSGGGEWSVVAAETPTDPISQASGTNAKLETFLAKHSHKLLGTYPMTKAVEIATAYGKEWLAGREVEPECPCEDITMPDELDYDGIAHAVLGKMTPEERSAFARGEPPKTSKKPRGRVGSALKGARDVRQSKAAADHP